MTSKPAPTLVESKPIVVVDMRERIAGMSDGELNTLHENAARLARNGSERQRASASALIPAIEAEIATRQENAPAPARSRRAAVREIETTETSAEPPAATGEPVAGVAGPEPAVATHKFAIGGMVKLLRTMLGSPMDGLVYEVVRQLPDERNEFQYRVRTKDGRVERIVLESQLGAASATDISEAALTTGRPRGR